MTWGLLAAALARMGDKDRSEALIHERGESPNSVWGRVLYHLLCSDIDAAATWYETMIERREPFAIVFNSDLITRPLRSSRHWSRLARMMNLPEQH